MTSDKVAGVQSLERALIIMDTLSSQTNGLSIKELSERTNLHKSTVHRLLQTLRLYNYVYQDNRTEQYHLGAKILEMGANMMDSFDVRTIARPVLESLCKEVGEAVHLCILDGLAAVYIDKIDNETRSIRMYSQIGKRIPVFCSASGKVLIAWLDSRERNNLVSQIQFTKYTETTLADQQSLLVELDETTRKGYAVDWFEHEDSVFCVASPVFNREKRVAAAVSVSAGCWNMDLELFNKMRREVFRAAKQISKYMGCGTYPIAFDPVEEDIAKLKTFRNIG